MGNLVGYLIVGAIAGVLAKALMPGDKMEPKGCLMTTVLGCAGASLVGFVMHSVLREPPGGFLGSIFGATIGAVLILWVYAKLASGSGGSKS